MAKKKKVVSKGVNMTAPETAEAKKSETPSTRPESELETKLLAAVEAYRNKHYPGVDRKRVRYNKEGIEEIIKAFKAAFSDSQNMSHLCELCGITTTTGKSWLDMRGSNGKQERPMRVGTGRVVGSGNRDQISMNIKKEHDGSLTVKLQPEDVKTFLANM